VRERIGEELERVGTAKGQVLFHGLHLGETPSRPLIEDLGDVLAEFELNASTLGKANPLQD